jgi:hypothetical protein
MDCAWKGKKLKDNKRKEEAREKKTYNASNFLEIISSTGRNFAKEDLFSSTSTESHTHHIKELKTNKIRVLATTTRSGKWDQD